MFHYRNTHPTPLTQPNGNPHGTQKIGHTGHLLEQNVPRKPICSTMFHRLEQTKVPLTCGNVQKSPNVPCSTPERPPLYRSAQTQKVGEKMRLREFQNVHTFSWNMEQIYKYRAFPQVRPCFRMFHCLEHSGTFSVANHVSAGQRLAAMFHAGTLVEQNCSGTASTPYSRQ